MGSLMQNELSYDLDSLAADVFSLTEENSVVESLTGAHGMTELAASCPTFSFCSGSCSVSN